MKCQQYQTGLLETRVGNNFLPMKLQFTAIVEKGEKFLIASCLELPEANGQGRTRAAALRDLAASIQSVLEYRRQEALAHTSPERRKNHGPRRMKRRELLRHLENEGCHEEFASYAHGTKGSAVISTVAHTPAQCRIFKGQTVNWRDFKSDNLAWAFPQPEPNPYQLEWQHLLDAIRQDQPYNEVKRGAEASLVVLIGRRAVHTGQIVTFEDTLNCDEEFAPSVDKLTMDSPAPLQLGPDGKYPQPQPGIKKTREC